MANSGSTINNIFSLRLWCRENLPTDNSLIAYDLILLLAHNHNAKKNITVKQLYSSLPHSYTAVRQHYNRFISNGLITLNNDGLDRRIKYIEPTTKLLNIIEKYVEVAEEIFTPPLALISRFNTTLR